MTAPLIPTIDTDPGVDDAIATLVALPDLANDLPGLTTVLGNLLLSPTTRNALARVEMAGAATPVAEGAARPLVQPPEYPDFAHGANGLGAVAMP